MSPRKKADLGKALGVRQASILSICGRMGRSRWSTCIAAYRSATMWRTRPCSPNSAGCSRGLVAKSNDGGSHLDMRYRASITREGVVSTIVAQTLGGLISAHGPAAVHGFVDAVANDPGALDELRRLLDHRSRKQR